MVTDTDITLQMSAQVMSDIDAVTDYLDLGDTQRDRLVRAVTGHVSGNPNIPVYRLVQALARAGIAGRLPKDCEGAFFYPDISDMPLQHQALFAFLFQMNSYRHAFDVVKLCRDLEPGCDEIIIRSVVRDMVRFLQAYRTDHLHSERHQRSFGEIRKFLNESGVTGPTDGHAMRFWSYNPSPTRWRQYRTAAHAMIHYVEYHMERDAVASSLRAGGQIIDYGSETVEEAATDPVETLSAALSTIQDGPLPIFLKVEEACLVRIIRLGPRAGSWPLTGMGVAGFTPIQLNLIQSLRDKGKLGPADIEASLSPPPQAEDERRDILKLADLCREATQMVYQAGQRLDLLPKQPEKPHIRKLRTLSRRDVFRSLSDEDLWTNLIEVTPAITLLRVFLEKVAKQWQGCIEKKPDDFMAEWALFDHRIREMYLSRSDVNE